MNKHLGYLREGLKLVIWVTAMTFLLMAIGFLTLYVIASPGWYTPITFIALFIVVSYALGRSVFGD